MRPDLVEGVDEGDLVGEVGLQERHAIFDVFDSIEGFSAGASDDAVDVVVFFQEEIGEVGAVLSGDAGDEGAFLFGVGHSRYSIDLG